MERSNPYYEAPSDSVTIYLDRYTAKRLLLALTQALEGGEYYGKKGKGKGKGWGGKVGMKIGKKGYKSGTGYGLKLSYRPPAYSGGDTPQC